MAPLAAAVVEVAAVGAVFVDDDDKFSAAVTAVEAGPAVVLVPSESAVAVDGVAAAVEKLAAATVVDGAQEVAAVVAESAVAVEVVETPVET